MLKGANAANRVCALLALQPVLRWTRFEQLTRIPATKAHMIHTTQLDRFVSTVPNAGDDQQEHTKMYQWAHRVKRLMATKSQVSAGLSRFVIDAEIEPYRVYYRKHGALLGTSDEQMLSWFFGRTE